MQDGTTKEAPFLTPLAAQNCDEPCEVPELTNAELVHLRVRVIALENLVIPILAGATVRKIDLAREMALRVSPNEIEGPCGWKTH